MTDTETLMTQIREAFASNEYPGDWCLRGSNEGEEPFLLEEEFKGKDDWQSLDPKFLDQAPDGYSSALSFFSDEAFRFCLPAYLLADVNSQLERADVLFHLCYGLDDSLKDERVNPRRYGERTWFDERSHTFAMFTRQQAAAIVAYLRYKHDSEDLSIEKQQIEQVLTNYWLERAG